MNDLKKIEKKCTGCGVSKSISDFPNGELKRGARAGKSYVNARCIDCNKEYMKIWRDKQTQESKYKRKISNKINVLKNRFGITQELYDNMTNSQNGVCAICGGVEASGRSLSVDHNHFSGEVRGLLCHSCNVSLGLLKEDIGRLENMVIYIKKYESSN